jgi:hypothetical protein
MNKRQAFIRSVMVEVTAKYLAELNSQENPFFDNRSNPFFEWDINCGDCEDWANDVERKLEAAGIACEVLGNDNFIRYQDLANHVFIRIGRKYYDCECLEGVSRIMDLPIYSRNLNLEREEARAFYKIAA